MTATSSLTETASNSSELNEKFEEEERAEMRENQETRQEDHMFSNTSDGGLERQKTEVDVDSNQQAMRSNTGSTVSRFATATEPPKFSLPREIAFVAIMCSAQLLTQAGLALSIAPLHLIALDFGNPGPGQLSWLSAAFSLTVGTFILPAGRWGDLYGHKKLFVIGWFWYFVWSLIAGFSAWSHSLPFFAFCRAMQGIGAAILNPNAIAVLARTYPPGPRKNFAISIYGACAPGGFIVGAVFTGIFSQFVWWPWAYWVHGMGLAVIGVIAVFIIPSMPVLGNKPTWRELDLPGTLLGVSGLVLFNFAWNQGPLKNWQEVYVWVLLILAVLMIGLFLFVEAKFTAFPLLPMTAFTRDTVLVFGCLSAGWASFGTWVYYFWQFNEVLKGNSVLLSTAKASPAAVSGAIAAVVTGFLVGKIQPGWIMLMSMTFFCTGIILLATTPINRSYWAQFFISTIVTPWGMDMSFPSGTIILSNHMPPEQQGLAASLVTTVVNYSISIGLGIAGTVEVNVNNGGKDLLAGYRGAWYVGIGLDVLGILLAASLVISWRATMKARAKANTSAQDA